MNIVRLLSLITIVTVASAAMVVTPTVTWAKNNPTQWLQLENISLETLLEALQLLADKSVSTKVVRVVTNGSPVVTVTSTVNNSFTHHSHTADLNLASEYKVTNGSLVHVNGKNIVAYRKLWQKFATIAGAAEVSENISKFVVYKDRNQTDAYMETTGDGKWTFGIQEEEVFVDDEDGMNQLLIHELAHVLTLDDQEMSSFRSTDCNTLYLSEGCLRVDSYYYQFAKQFWSKRDRKYVEANVNNQRAMQRFYRDYQNHFVSRYAVTSVAEDIAESFAQFVLEPTPRGNTVAEQKIKFFYRYPELVKERQRILQAL